MPRRGPTTTANWRASSTSCAARRACAGASGWNSPQRLAPAISSMCPRSCRIRKSTPARASRSNACWCAATTRQWWSTSTSSLWRSLTRCYGWIRFTRADGFTGTARGATPFPTGSTPSAARLNLHPGRIRLVEFCDLDSADIGKEIGGEIARDLMGDRGEWLIVVPAFDGKAQVPGMKRGATLGANDDVQFWLLGRGIAKRRDVAGERHLHLASGFASQESHRNIGDLKPPVARSVFPDPYQLLPALHRFLQRAGVRRNFKHGWPLQGRELGCVRLGAAGLVRLRVS